MAAVPAAERLAGLTVIDLTTNIAGPLCARLFAEFGANVIHVEPPWGDDGRNSTTPFLGQEGTLHSTGNRSKRGMVINIKTPGGHEAMRRLIRDADLLIENMQPGNLDKLGLGYSTLKVLNPRLVQVSVTGWGARGPRAGDPGYGPTGAAYSGLVRWPIREEEVPELQGGAVGDLTAALLAFSAAMVALRTREQTGEGSVVTTSVFQGSMHQAASMAVRAEDDPSPRLERRESQAIGAIGGYGQFMTSDEKWIYIAAFSDPQFKRLMGVIGMPHVGENAQYGSRAQRGIHRAELSELIRYWVSTKSCEEALAALRQEGIPVAPMHRGIDELYDDPQVAANDMFVTIEHPTKGRLRQLRTMFEIDGEYGRTGPAPLLGQHTNEVLAEYGYSAEEIGALRASGAVA